MPVNRQLFEEPFSKSHMPSWHCPSCTGGYLRLKAESLHALQTSESLKAQDHEAWDADWVILRFSALLQCNNDSCSESVGVTGRGRVEIVQTSAYDGEYVEFFYPEYFNPSPSLIALPHSCPEEVTAEIKRAFVASWGDCPAAVNRIRAGVERLLDFLKEPKTKINRKGARERISLHNRIVALGARDRALSDSLLAIKWLGNVGSHSDAVSRSDVFDALDILEIVLDELFIKHRKRVTELVSAINKKKGPYSRPSKKTSRTATKRVRRKSSP